MIYTLIVATVILAYVTFVVVRQVQKAKRGETSCGCGCDGCSQAQNCHH